MLQIGPTTDIATCQALRRQVFIVEQNVAEALEVDGLDDRALHVLAKLDDTPVGTARLVPMDDVAKIGRVCVLPDHRGTGLGAGLIRATLDLARGQPRFAIARLGAQTHALGFYERLGFTAHGPDFDDAGIAHRLMDYPLR